MAKKTVNPKKVEAPSKFGHSKPETQAKHPGPRAFLPSKYTSGILVLLLFVIISLIYFPVAYQQKFPQASDITQWEGAARKIIDYNQEHSDRALWTPNMFSGMPSYMISFPNRFPYLESITKLTDKLINWRIFLLFLGGMGIFILLRFLKIDPWIALFGAVVFVFSCHWVGLLEIGHNTKFRAIMYVPWVLWALMYLRKTPGILGLGLLATFLITQLRENHPQITYYLYLLIGMYWVFSLIETIKNKEWKRLGVYTLLLILAFGLTALAVMNPYLSTLEYSHHTMRGGSAGLEKSYAQGWSFHPLEIFSLIIPNLFGGINNDYWGWMPFTQIYNYFGIIVLVFGIFALLGKHRRLAIFLWISSVIFTLMSFGEFAPAISDLLLAYLPYFNKFRVPSMILTMVQINSVILAALGLSTIVEKAESGDKPFSNRLYRCFWISGVIFLIFFVLGKPVFGGMKLTNRIDQGRIANEIQRQAQTEYTEAQLASELERVSEVLGEQRLKLLYKSGILSLLLLTLAIGLAYLYSSGKLKRNLFVMLILILSFIDLWVYTGKHFKDLRPVQEHRDIFTAKDFDNFLLSDNENYRVLPYNTGAPGNWAYYHQTLNGYSAAKLKRYDDVLNRNILPQYNRFRQVWNQYGQETPTPVHDMLNTKYYIASQDTMDYSMFLQQKPLVYKSPYYAIKIYENKTALPRAWFVDSLKVVTPADSIVALMNQLDFEPRRFAYVESEIPNVAGPDTTAYVKATGFEMHKLSYELQTDRNSFLVLSEIYYPAGWKAYLDGKEIPIYPANYILRGLAIPAGKHKLELRFEPESYSQGVLYSAIGLSLTFIFLLAGIIWEYRKNRNIALDREQ